MDRSILGVKVLSHSEYTKISTDGVWIWMFSLNKMFTNLRGANPTEIRTHKDKTFAEQSENIHSKRSKLLWNVYTIEM